MSTFLGAVRLLSGFSPVSTQSSWDRLSVLTGLSETELAPMRWNTRLTEDGARIKVLTRDFAPAHVHSLNMRFCPECFAEQNIRRDFWALSKVVACPKHGSLLADVCPSCRKTYTSAAVGKPEACPCGMPFAQVASKPAPNIAVMVARNLALMIGPELAVEETSSSWSPDLAPAFANIGAFDYLSYLDVLGTAASTPAEDDALSEATATNYIRGFKWSQLALPLTLKRLVAAEEIMRGWPGSFLALLDDVSRRREVVGTPQSFHGAFSTAVGRSLRHPVRGEDGRPLPLIVQAVDDYWKERDRKRRSRNPSVKDSTARRLHSLINPAVLAQATGKAIAGQFHSRVVRRVIDLLNDEERSLAPSDLARLVKRRSLELHRSAKESMYPTHAKKVVEGTRDHLHLAGWDHPELLRPDPMLRDLRLAGEMYSKVAVDAVLDRLSAIATKRAVLGPFVPLVADAMRYRLRRPAPTKTEVLLRIFRGDLPVYSLMDRPTLGDLFVDVDELNGDYKARVAEATIGPYLRERHVNDLMRVRHGEGALLTVNELHRLVRAELVRAEIRVSHLGTLGCPVTAFHFHIEDLDAIVTRRCAGACTEAELDAFGCEIDVGPLMRALHNEGLSPTALAQEMTLMNIVTVRGATWNCQMITRDLKKAEGVTILGIQKRAS